MIFYPGKIYIPIHNPVLHRRSASRPFLCCVPSFKLAVMVDPEAYNWLTWLLAVPLILAALAYFVSCWEHH